MIKAIIFDVEGVINQAVRFSEQLEKKYGITREKTSGFFASDFFAQCKIGQADLKAGLSTWLKEWGWTGTMEELLDFWFKSGENLDLEMVNKIKELREQGLICYIATRQEKYRSDYMRDAMGLKDMVEDFFSTADIGCTKHERKFFEVVYQEIIKKNPEIKPEEILFVDNEEKNIAVAKEFGFQTYFYKNYQSFNADLSLIRNK